MFIVLMESEDYERQSLTHLGAVEGYARASNIANKSSNWCALPNRIKLLSNDTVRHIRCQNTHTAGGAGLEPAARKHVVPTYLPLDHLPPWLF
jgi:hypothetical protein